MARTYAINFVNVSVSTVVDLISIKAGAANPLELHCIELSALAVATPSELSVRLKRLPATVTQGSGGAVFTPNPIDSGDTKVAAATTHTNDTTQATTSGTALILAAWGWNVLNPFIYYPDRNQLDNPKIQAGEALILDLSAAPGAAINLSGYAIFLEP
jgi:hypothetical protein